MGVNLASIVLIITAIGGLCATATALYRLQSERKKLVAEAASMVTSSAIELLAPLKKRIDFLNTELEACRKRVRALEEKHHG